MEARAPTIRLILLGEQAAVEAVAEIEPQLLEMQIKAQAAVEAEIPELILHGSLVLVVLEL